MGANLCCFLGGSPLGGLRRAGTALLMKAHAPLPWCPVSITTTPCTSNPFPPPPLQVPCPSPPAPSPVQLLMTPAMSDSVTSPLELSSGT